MGSFTNSISDETAAWIAEQPMFFVATAPRHGNHVNVSPKGLDTFRVLGPNRAAFLDLTGSGVETIAHLRENGRLTVMFCAFAGPPRIVRLYGVGRVTMATDESFQEIAAPFPEYTGTRSVISMDVERVGSSCGFGVPEMSEPKQRHRLLDWAEAKGADSLPDYWASKNRVSIDGLPGVGQMSAGVAPD